jgi:hypothetical protein
MPLNVTITWTNRNPDTVYNKLKARLGREPTQQELVDEVTRILRDTPTPTERRRG